MYVMCIRSLVRLAPIRPHLRFWTALIAHHRTWLVPAHICTGTKPNTHPHLQLDCNICPGNESVPRPHLHRDRIHCLADICATTAALRDICLCAATQV